MLTVIEINCHQMAIMSVQSLSMNHFAVPIKSQVNKIL